MRSGEFLPVNLNQVSSNIPRVCFIQNVIKSFPPSTLWTQFVALSAVQPQHKKNLNFPVCAFKIFGKSQNCFGPHEQQWLPSTQACSISSCCSLEKKKKSGLVFLPLVCREARCSTHGSLESTSSDLLMKNSLVCASSSSSSGWWYQLPPIS